MNATRAHSAPHHTAAVDTQEQPTLSEERPGSSPLHLRLGIAVHLGELQRRARALTRSNVQADDLVQDTVVRALRFESTFQEGGYLRAWLLRIMHNVFISQRRRVATERRILEGAGHDPNGWATLKPAQQMPALSPSVERAMQSLPQKLRTVIECVDLADHSYRDAAEVHGVPVGTIMSRLHRGRARLCGTLGQQAA